MQKRSKKGFTLAELLIVVAIIAILIAIAVPLFVGALDKAEEAVKEANIRSVKSAAVASILSNDTKLNEEIKGKKYWKATACITKNGDVEHLTVTAQDSSGTDIATKGECTEHEGDNCKCGHDKDTSNKCECKYFVSVNIRATDLEDFVS